jgi:7,8-dihydropterin-6-yl-methyl-4-(beta-D-ribofuranosyl)aminobenzene 5'-phosphate synthase
MCQEHGGQWASAGSLPPELFWEVSVPEGLQLDPVDRVTVRVVMDNAVDLLADQPGVQRVRRNRDLVQPVPTFEGGLGPDGLVAEHGFACWVEVERAGRTRTLLFDTGVSPRGAAGNLRRLGLDPRTIEAVVLSHGHFDHTGGLVGLAEALGGRVALPLVLHPDGWRRRRLAVPGQEPLELPTPSRQAIEGLGFEVLDGPRPSLLLDGSVLLTGEVARTSGFEPGLPGQEAFLAGRWQDDRLTADDQALVVDVAGRGLVVVTGCGHAGVVNLCRFAQRLADGRPLWGIVGGFHLGGPMFSPTVPRVLDELAELRPELLVPGHCTGWRAQQALATRFSSALVQSVVGTEVTVTCPPPEG